MGKPKCLTNPSKTYPASRILWQSLGNPTVTKFPDWRLSQTRRSTPLALFYQNVAYMSCSIREEKSHEWARQQIFDGDSGNIKNPVVPVTGRNKRRAARLTLLTESPLSGYTKSNCVESHYRTSYARNLAHRKTRDNRRSTSH